LTPSILILNPLVALPKRLYGHLKRLTASMERLYTHPKRLRP
jgi:hypothetical protein